MKSALSEKCVEQISGKGRLSKIFGKMFGESGETRRAETLEAPPLTMFNTSDIADNYAAFALSGLLLTNIML